MKSPQRGEVWLVDLGMAAKVGPAVVMSVPADDHDRALVTLIPHTTSPRSSRFEVAVGAPGKLSGAQLAAVERVVCTWLGIPTSDAEV